MMLTDNLLQLSMEDPLTDVGFMYAAHGVIIEPSGLVRRVEFKTHPTATEPVRRFGPLWMRVDDLSADELDRQADTLRARAATLRRKDHP